MLGRVGVVSFLTGTLLAMPAVARPFSAQDVMTVCTALASDPKRLLSVFELQGWDRVEDGKFSTYMTDLGVAHVAAERVIPKAIHGTSSDQDFWQASWEKGQSYLDKAKHAEGITLFHHEETGALLLTHEFSAKASVNFSCLLAVPASLLDEGTYFPKLRAATAPALSYSIADALVTESSRGSVYIQSASLAPEAISKALGITTDIGAAFSSRTSYPKSALEP